MRFCAGLFLLLGLHALVSCGSSNSSDYSTPVCTQKRVSVVFRLDYLTLQPKSFAVLTPEGEPLASEDAAEAALHAFAPLVFSEAFAGMEEWEENPFKLAALTGKGSDVYAAFYEPGDFGGVALMDAHTSQPVFLGETVWMGDGKILYPESWNPADTLDFLHGGAAAPESLTVVDPYSSGSCCDAQDDECLEVACTTGEAAFEAVRKSRLLRDIAFCGSYSVLALMYPVSVGMTNFNTAEWIVVVSGMAPEPVVAGLYASEPRASECEESSISSSLPPKLLAAYKICPSTVYATREDYFWAEFGQKWGAFLYSDGTLLYRNPSAGSSWFLKKQLVAKAWCTVREDVDSRGFKDEANAGTIAITEGTDDGVSMVFLRDHESAATVSLYGTLWESLDWLMPNYIEQAPNAIALAKGLREFEGVLGQPYTPEQVALWAQAPGEGGTHPEPCGGDLPEWPFAEIDLAKMVANDSFLDPQIQTLEAEVAKEVRAWWQESDGPEGLGGICVNQAGTAYRVYVLDLPPGGYEAIPLPSCRSTAI